MPRLSGNRIYGATIGGLVTPIFGATGSAYRAQKTGAGTNWCRAAIAHAVSTPAPCSTAPQSHPALAPSVGAAAGRPMARRETPFASRLRSEGHHVRSSCI